MYFCHVFIVGLSANTDSMSSPYGGCAYESGATPDTKQFWGCGVPGKNEDLMNTMEKFTTDTGCGNLLVRWIFSVICSNM